MQILLFTAAKVSLILDILYFLQGFMYLVLERGHLGLVSISKSRKDLHFRWVS